MTRMWRERQGDLSEPSLAIVLQRWMRQERLRPYEIARASGLSRSHVGLLLHGRIARPSPDALRRLATGLATDPYTETVDPAKRAAALRDLSVAAGFEDLSRLPEAGSVRAALLAAGLEDQPARFYESLIADYPSPNPTVQQLLRAILERHGQPGGERVTNRLLALVGTPETEPAVPPDTIATTNGT